MSRLESILLARGVICDDDRPTRTPRPPHLVRRFGVPTQTLAIRTQSEVAAMLGVKRCYVNEVEQRALRKLRQEIERRASLAGVSVNEWMEL